MGQEHSRSESAWHEDTPHMHACMDWDLITCVCGTCLMA